MGQQNTPKPNLAFIDVFTGAALCAVTACLAYGCGATMSEAQTRRLAEENGFTVSKVGGGLANCPPGNFFRTRFEGAVRATGEKVGEGAVCKPLFRNGVTVVSNPPAARQSQSPKSAARNPSPRASTPCGN